MTDTGARATLRNEAHAALDRWLDNPDCQGCRATAEAVIEHHRATNDEPEPAPT
jgi:hypothetical protein